MMMVLDPREWGASISSTAISNLLRAEITTWAYLADNNPSLSQFYCQVNHLECLYR